MAVSILYLQRDFDIVADLGKLVIFYDMWANVEMTTNQHKISKSSDI